MKIAVSALEPSLDSTVDERFGRANVLLIVDTETFEFEILDNTVNQRALEGSGIGAAELVCNHAAAAVLTGHLGPKAFQTLQMIGIIGFDSTGMSVREAVELFNEKKLEVLSEGKSNEGLN